MFLEKYGKCVMKKEESDKGQGCSVGTGQMVCSFLVQGRRLRFYCQCDWKPLEIPVAPGEEHYVLDKSLDEVYFALQ